MNLYIQNRDKELLRLLADSFPLLTREQIQELIPRGIRRTNQRLSRLIEGGYHNRREPVDAWSPRVVLYYIGEKAAEALAQDRQEIVRQMTRARNLKNGSLKHLYLTTEVLIQFSAAERAYCFSVTLKMMQLNYCAVGIDLRY